MSYVVIDLLQIIMQELILRFERKNSSACITIGWVVL